jgi:hypothetical protein
MGRQTTKEKGRPFSIRLTEIERAKLGEKAGRLPIGVYVRSVLLDDATPGRVIHRRYPENSEKILATILAALGQSRLASNLNQLAKAVHSGSLPVNARTEADIDQACRDVALIRRALLMALGVESDDAKPRLADEFARAAGGSSS